MPERTTSDLELKIAHKRGFVHWEEAAVDEAKAVKKAEKRTRIQMAEELLGGGLLEGAVRIREIIRKKESAQEGLTELETEVKWQSDDFFHGLSKAGIEVLGYSPESGFKSDIYDSEKYHSYGPLNSGDHVVVVQAGYKVEGELILRPLVRKLE